MCTKNNEIRSHEMITSSKEAVCSSKQEGNTSEGKIIITKASSSSAWLRLKDPRIVRMSRAFGGKDRHSKVCTIRGLRDRRVRLSVPTAIQLYDLQDRLGLNQPSKVVDWLLNAAKDEIDELPPLPAIIPHANFGLNNHHQEIILSSNSNEAAGGAGSSQVSNRQGCFSIKNWESADPRSENAWSSEEALWRAANYKSKLGTENANKENWTKRSDPHHREKVQDNVVNVNGEASSSINFLPRRLSATSTNSSLPPPSNNLFNNANALPFGPYYHLEPPNFPFSHHQYLASHGLNITSQTEDFHNFNVVQWPSPLSLSSAAAAGSQILVCPPPPPAGAGAGAGATQPLVFPSQINHFQMLSPTNSSHSVFANSLFQTTPHTIRPFHLGMTSRFIPSDSGTVSQSDKDKEFPSK